MNILINAFNGSDVFGKAIFLALLFLSIVTWILVVRKTLSHRNAKMRAQGFHEAFQKRRLNPLSLEASDLHPFAALYHALKVHTFELLGKNKAVRECESVTLSTSDIKLLESHLMSTLSSESQKLEKNLFLLSTIVSLAPFLGLLGTVWGILLTFNELQTATGVNTNATMMGGLAMALGTTVAGLLVAIPALVGYNYLRSRTAEFTGEMEDFSQLLLNSVELQYRQVEIK